MIAGPAAALCSVVGMTKPDTTDLHCGYTYLSDHLYPAPGCGGSAARSTGWVDTTRESAAVSSLARRTGVPWRETWGPASRGHTRSRQMPQAGMRTLSPSDTCPDTLLRCLDGRVQAWVIIIRAIFTPQPCQTRRHGDALPSDDPEVVSAHLVSRVCAGLPGLSRLQQGRLESALHRRDCCDPACFHMPWPRRTCLPRTHYWDRGSALSHFGPRTVVTPVRQPAAGCRLSCPGGTRGAIRCCLPTCDETGWAPSAEGPTLLTVEAQVQRTGRPAVTARAVSLPGCPTETGSPRRWHRISPSRQDGVQCAALSRAAGQGVWGHSSQHHITSHQITSRSGRGGHRKTVPGM